jgi:hypothetical protein
MGNQFLYGTLYPSILNFKSAKGNLKKIKNLQTKIAGIPNLVSGFGQEYEI